MLYGHQMALKHQEQLAAQGLSNGCPQIAYMSQNVSNDGGHEQVHLLTYTVISALHSSGCCITALMLAYFSHEPVSQLCFVG